MRYETYSFKNLHNYCKQRIVYRISWFIRWFMIPLHAIASGFVILPLKVNVSFNLTIINERANRFVVLYSWRRQAGRPVVFIECTRTAVLNVTRYWTSAVSSKLAECVQTFYNAKLHAPTCSALVAWIRFRHSRDESIAVIEVGTNHTASDGLDNFIRQRLQDMLQWPEVMARSAGNVHVLVERQLPVERLQMLDAGWMIAFVPTTEVTSSNSSHPRLAVNCITSNLIGLSWRRFTCRHEQQLCSLVADLLCLTVRWRFQCHQHTGDGCSVE